MQMHQYRQWHGHIHSKDVYIHCYPTAVYYTLDTSLIRTLPSVTRCPREVVKNVMGGIIQLYMQFVWGCGHEEELNAMCKGYSMRVQIFYILMM